jgi:anti-anti-sigma regulatory factor
MPMSDSSPVHKIMLNGECTIRHAAEFHSALIGLIPRHLGVELDCTGVTEADLAFLQLLAAAGKTVAASGRRLVVTVPVDGVVARAASRAGFAEAWAATLPSDPFHWHPVAMETTDGQDHPHRG